MNSNFNEEASEILVKAKLEMLELRHPYVGTEHLVLAILHTDSEIKNKLEKYDLTYNKFKKEIINIIGKGSKKSEFFLHTPLLKKVIENAIMDSKENNNGIVTVDHLFASLLDIGEGIAIRIFIGMNLDLDTMYEDFYEKIYDKNKNAKKKLLIEELGINLCNNEINNNLDPLIGREKEIHELEEILCRRTKNNPLLIGPPGVGKTAIVEGLATLIKNNEVPNKLLNKKIISLDMASAVSGTKYRGEFEERMKKIISEVENNEDIILFIDEIHTLIGAGGAEGAIDASNILKPALARGKIRCIGATTIDEYKKNFSKDKALERRFQTITVEEPTIEETINILTKIKPIYEKYHNVIINDNIIHQIINLTEKYVYNRYRPDKELDILDEVCSKVNIGKTEEIIKYNHNLSKIRDKKELYIKENNIEKAYKYKIKETNYKNKYIKNNENKEVTLIDIANVISNKTSIPIYEIIKDNKKIITNIEKELKSNIIGQDTAIETLINVTKRIKLGYKDNKCISLLFIGPSGVGKTQMALTYGNLISKQKIIKLDMSEYSDSMSISKFVGSSAGYIGYDDNTYALNTIKDNPNATIILDEIDKANPKIINMIYQILEEGIIKDAKNNIINFANNIIIMTATANQENKIGFTNNKKELNNTELLSTPFLNRVDNIIKFNILSKEAITNIINKNLKLIKTKYQNITINFDKKITEEIINEANYQNYGARRIEKIINNKIENTIIDAIIDDKKEIYIDSIFSK